MSIDFDLPHTQGYLVAHVNRYGTYSPIDGLICLDVMQAVASLIRSTDHFQASSITHPLKAVMLGADLAILGQSEGVYAQYKQAIRAEYAHVPLVAYQINRHKALQHLHAKALAHQLYADAYFAQL